MLHSRTYLLHVMFAFNDDGNIDAGDDGRDIFFDFSTPLSATNQKSAFDKPLDKIVRSSGR